MASRRAIFDEKIAKKSENVASVILTKSKYDELVTSVLKIRSDGKREPKDYWLSKRYDVIEVSKYEIVQ